MFPAFTSEKGARKFIREVGDNADDLLHLRWCDQGGKSEYPTDPTMTTDNQQALVNAARIEKVPTNKSMLAINGRDLLQAGIPQGPQMGQVLEYLTDQVIDNPELNTKEALMGLAQSWKPSQPQ
jgi:tRNA nucleotidyltransferase (CCA-adding enzyme)